MTCFLKLRPLKILVLIVTLARCSSLFLVQKGCIKMKCFWINYEITNVAQITCESTIDIKTSVSAFYLEISDKQRVKLFKANEITATKTFMVWLCYDHLDKIAIYCAIMNSCWIPQKSTDQNQTLLIKPILPTKLIAEQDFDGVHAKSLHNHHHEWPRRF